MIAAGCRGHGSLVQPGEQHWRFCLTVTLAHTGPKYFHALPESVGRDRRARQQEQAQARVIKVAYAGMRQHAVKGSWRQEKMSDFVALDMPHHLERVKSLHYQVGRALREHRKRDNSSGVR